MDMDLTTFSFFVIPGWFCLVGVIFCLVFGGGLLRSYLDKRSEQMRAKRPTSVESPEPLEFVDRAARKQEKELVGSH